MPIPWALIIELMIRLIANCMENRQSRERIFDRLRNPSGREAWALRKILRENTELRGRDLRVATHEGIGQLAAMEEGDINEMLDEAAAIAAA